MSESFMVLYLLLFKGTEQGIGISHAQREGETRAAVRLRHHNLLILQLPDLLCQRINHRVQQVRDQVWGKENKAVVTMREDWEQNHTGLYYNKCDMQLNDFGMNWRESKEMTKLDCGRTVSQTNHWKLIKKG